MEGLEIGEGDVYIGYGSSERAAKRDCIRRAGELPRGYFINCGMPVELGEGDTFQITGTIARTQTPKGLRDKVQA